jgi:membrane fusion protein, multidrug efflux system
MTVHVAELETLPAEPTLNEKPDIAPTRANDDQPRPMDGLSNENEGQEIHKLPAPRPRWPLVLVGLFVAIFAATVLFIIFRPRADIRTADAYVMVHYAAIAPRISGQVAAVPVDDNDVVKAGQVLATLDPRDNATALAAAEAAVARDRSQLDEISATTSRQPSIIEEQQAAVESARARLAFAQANARRYRNLATTGAGTMQEHQQADTTLEQDQASLDSAQASLDAVRRQLDVLKAQISATEAAVKADEARLEQATLNLSYTQIRAPIDGGWREIGAGRQLCRPRHDVDDCCSARPSLCRSELSRSGTAARPRRPACNHPCGCLRHRSQGDSG